MHEVKNNLGHLGAAATPKKKSEPLGPLSQKSFR
jgi:hypothetical protein